MTKVKRRVFGENWMAYLLVAGGALMFVLGVYAAVTGARIVQVEAGWTSVIAGSMLLVGGVLTAALGLVLRAINRLASDLRAEAVESNFDQRPVTQEPIFVDPATTDASAILQEPTFPQAPVVPSETASRQEPMILPDLEPEPPHEPTLAEAPSDPKPAATDPSTLIGSPPLPSVRPRQAASTPSVLRPRPSLFRRKTASRPTAGEAPPAEETARDIHEPIPGEPASPVQAADSEAASFFEQEAQERIEAARPADDFKIDTPPMHEPPPAPPGRELTIRVPDPGEEDWIDRALAEFDDVVPSQEGLGEPNSDKHAFEDAPPEAEPEHLEPEGAEAAAESPKHVADEPPPALAPSLPPAPTLKTPAPVIGRYEAEGTTYVMYADGSIEAHSDAGIYRFASMTELKAFMET